MSWKKVFLGSLYELPSRNGLTRPSKVRGVGYKMVNMGELFANEWLYDIPMERVQLNDREKRECLIAKNDLLFARQSLVASGAGKCSIVREVKEPTTFESHLIRVRLDTTKAVPLFYYYYFKSPLSPMKTIVTICAQAGIRGSDLATLSVECPDLPTQRRIASILSAYDDLIENNRRQIKLLEEAAQRLYREWFVELRFPGHEGVKVVDGVPEGWKIETVGSLLRKIPRTKQILTSDYQVSGNIPIVDQSRDFIAGYTNDTDACVKPQDAIIVFGDHTRILKYITFPFAKGADGTQLIVSNSDCMPQSLFYFSMIHIDLTNYHYARHFKYLKESTILVPTKSIANAYDNIVHPIMKRIQVLRDSCVKAKEARDRLLPILMNREMEVSE